MIERTTILILELAVLFFGVAFLVHITQRRLGEEKLRRWMGGRPLVSALKGIAVGFITPFCTYSAIPMFLGLRRAGVPPAGYVAFIVAAPVLDPVLFGALVLIVGLKAALIYLAVAFTAALTLALLAERFDLARHMKPDTATATVRSSRVPAMAVAGGIEQETTGSDVKTCNECSDMSPWRGFNRESKEAAGAAVGLIRSFGPLLLLGVGIGLAIEVLVPPESVAAIAGNGNSLAIPLAAGLGTPLYISTQLFVPIADSLTAVGVGIGAIVALTISGAGANVPEFVILSRLAKGRVLAIFITYVFVVAIAGGFLAQVLVV